METIYKLIGSQLSRMTGGNNMSFKEEIEQLKETFQATKEKGKALGDKYAEEGKSIGNEYKEKGKDVGKQFKDLSDGLKDRFK